MTKRREKPETALIRQCLDILRLHRVAAWRMNTGAVSAEYKGRSRFIRFGPKGMSDILGIMWPSGRFLAIETKAGNNKLTPEQDEFQRQVREAGGYAWTIRDVAELQRRLEAER